MSDEPAHRGRAVARTRRSSLRRSRPRRQGRRAGQRGQHRCRRRPPPCCAWAASRAWPAPRSRCRFPFPARAPQILVDGGATVDSLPSGLAQFALMGREYAQLTLRDRRANGRPALQRRGGGQGRRRSARAAYPLLAEIPGFVGNVEGPRLHAGRHRRRDRHRRLHRQRRAQDDRRRDAVDRRGSCSTCSTRPPRRERLVGRDAPPARGGRDLDPDSDGGAVLLGVDGVCVISHGSSSARADRGRDPSRGRVRGGHESSTVCVRRSAMPAETHVESGSDRHPTRCCALIRERLGRDPRDRRRSDHARLPIRRRPRRRLAGADRAGRGPRGGARRAHGRVQRRRRRPRDLTPCATPSTTSWPASQWLGGRRVGDEALLASRGRARPVRSRDLAPRAALTHRSYCAEHPDEESNERLEFLGDAVLGLVVTDFTSTRPTRTCPKASSPKLRASVVNAEVLAELAPQLDLGAALHPRQGRGRVGRPAQAVDPRRRDGSRDRRGLPRRRLGGRRRPGPAPARGADP